MFFTWLQSKFPSGTIKVEVDWCQDTIHYNKGPFSSNIVIRCVCVWGGGLPVPAGGGATGLVLVQKHDQCLK